MLRTIVEQARQGDEEAFGALVREVGDRCIFIAHRILRDASLAEDAVQVALVQVWRELPSLRDVDLSRRGSIGSSSTPATPRPGAAGTSRPMSSCSIRRTDRDRRLLTVHDRDQLDRGFRRLPQTSAPSSSSATPSG